ncbi:hypothetical protein B0O80DRAFT_429130 [Mortierella sp. GBAus27b]|nr:hypothetical protein BGX31_009648 [Mortierella sp. GBA43]KAI8349351.1 hypothetical protein B0O80DRAFT_429130 [Mortierella sp. GBAus27b]
MGQYYALINITKRLFFDNIQREGNVITFNQFTTGNKMIELLNGRGKKPILAMALTELSVDPGSTNPIAPMGTWFGDRIAIVGDNCKSIPPPFLTKAEEQELKESSLSNLYSLVEDKYNPVDISAFFGDHVGEELARLFPKGQETHHLVLNLDRKEYLDPIKFKTSMSYVGDFAHEPHGVMLGLYSQIFYSTGSGGGDVEPFMQGPWAGQRIGIREKEMVKDLDSWKDISEQVADKFVING